MKTNAILTMLITVLFLIPVITVCQTPDIKLSCKVGEQTPKGPTDNALLYGQLSNPSGENAVITQDFIEYPDYSCQAADDFTVPEGETWLIDEIFISGQYTEGGGPAPAAHLFIYLNDSLLHIPDTAIVSIIDFPLTASPDGDLVFDFLLTPGYEPFTLESGHYWISVQPHMSIVSYGQWFWKKQESPTILNELQWRNPQNGLGLSYVEWTPGSVVFEGTSDHNLAFGIYGEEVGCPLVHAGEDATICEGESFTASATASKACGLMWTTSGDGTFDNTGSLTATYTPGIADIANGDATLCLTGQACAPCTQNVQDCLEITIQAQATVFAGNDFFVCEGGQAFLSEATASNYSALQWITTNGAGYFDDDNVLNPTYFPSQMDYAQGCISMAVSANPISPCTNTVIDFINVCFQSLPNANAGIDATITAGNSYANPDATAVNFSSLLWSTTGDGTFDNSQIQNPTYTPGPGDDSNGGVTLCFDAQPINPCTSVATDCMVLTIEQEAFVDAGPDATICIDPSKNISGGKGCFPLNGSAMGYTTIQWYTTNGTGTFDNEHILTPCYYYTAMDILQGGVELKITGYSKSAKSSFEDSMILTFQEGPAADAGSDATICEGQNFNLSGTAGNYNSLSWGSSGDGYFNNPSLLNPVFTPGQLDILNGNVELCLTAFPVEPCSVSAMDCLQLHIQKKPVVDAGPDMTICADAEKAIIDQGLCNNASSTIWSTTGDGIFLDSGVDCQYVEYAPGSSDLANGFVELVLIGYPINPCTFFMIDNMVLNFQAPPTADAGADATITQWVSHQLSGTAQNSNSIVWTSSGTGTFSPPNVLNPQYSPSAADILAGSVQLCLTAQASAPCDDAIDCMTLTIQADPTVNAGNDTTICIDPAKGNGSKLCFPLNATVTNWSALQWTAINGFGDFSNEHIPNPCYNISPMDIIQGSVTLCLSAAPSPPATTYGYGCIVLTFQQNGTVSAGPDITITLTKNKNNPMLENGSIVLGGSATDYSSLSWTSTGDGTFDDTNIVNPSYTYSQGDIANGNIQLCLSAQPINPCTTEATDCMVLTFEQDIFVDAGPDATICVDPPTKTPGSKGCFPLQGTASGNYTDLLWTTTGNGTFDDEYSLTPCYYYSQDDIVDGGVELVFIANYPNPKSSFTDSMILTFQESPTVDAGGDATITPGQSYTNPDATATNFSSLLWSSSGDGSFINDGILNPTYTPGNGDESSGVVTLCLDALPVSPCQVSATDCMDLSIIALPSGLDFGDAPEMGGMFFSFPTTLAFGGAAHNIDPTIFLGNKIDGEPDGQPTVGADGDDNDVLYPSSGDDEDGVTLPASVFAASSVIITVKASVDGYLDAWMDFDLDHTWLNPMEHIFMNQALVAGNNNLTFIVPAIAVPGQSYLRFRFRDDATPLSFNGFANNGEVEDYTVLIKENTIEGWDFGDAPHDGSLYSYPTLLSNDGARHYFVPGIHLGTLLDIEPDGQATPNADGDDTDKYYAGLGDDEDGVTLPATVSPGAVTSVQVWASVPGFLDAWMDFDLDGTWTAADEHIFTNKPLNPGANTLSFTVSSTAVAGQSFLRFRFRDNAAPLSFTGAADNGEVEDYTIQIVQSPANGYDFGDAPDGIGSMLFPTLLNNNGARHTIVPGIHLGNLVDTEPDGQPDLAASGDDMDLVYPSAGDDEDGVTFTSQIISGSVITFDVVASVDGYLDAWMDFDGDGQWIATIEHVLTTVPLTAGTNNLSFNIPTTATPGTSYIRFRFRDYDNPVNYDGACENGEVEDYRVEIMDGSIPQMDFGDAPESTQPFLLSYPTTLAHNGAAHIIDPAVYLGYLIDAEPDGQPSDAADGDDNNGDIDEDGLSDDDMESVVPGSTVTITVTASVDGYLDAWMDFDRDNTWLAPNEHIFDMQALVAGSNTLTFEVPTGAVVGQSYLRLRFRDYEGPLSYDGIANNGEVEDYAILIEQGQATGMDFGDAPDGPYPTLTASDGARHINDGITWLGNFIDSDLDGLQSADSKGDDLNYVDDEDGVSFVNTMYAGGIATLQVVASVDGYLNAWMDFDQNGSWADAGDQVFTDEWLTTGVNTLSFIVPASAPTGFTFTRFRFGSQAGLTFTGLAQDGEVEDYQVTVYPAWSVLPTLNTHIISVPTGLPPLQAGDLLGVFFIDNSGQEQCGGTMLYSGQANQLVAYGDDEFTPAVKEGFATGETFKWKLFSAASGLVADVEADYDQSYPDHDGTFRPFGFSALTAINYPENPCGLPAGWEFTVTGQVHSINIPLDADPNIFGKPLNMGDWIGAFCDTMDNDCDDPPYPLVCAGAVQWTGASSVVINAYGDDPFTPAKDGFAAGKQIRWKIFDCDAMEELSAQATYNPVMPCQGDFGDFCMSELLSLEAAYFQDYSFDDGWNSISTYLVPSKPDVEDMFAANIDNTIILKNLTTVYWPYAGVNTIGNWDNESGYAIKVSDCFNMQIAGTEFTSREITLTPGWHYLPVLSPCDVNAWSLFHPQESNISIVTDLIGTKVWWSEMNIYTLETLEPGKAYKIRVTDPVTFMFPVCALKSQSIPSKVQNAISSPWGNVNITPSSHTISIMADAMTEMLEGDFIAAFDQNGILCGSVEIGNVDQNHVIVLFGDDPTTESKDGFMEGEPLEFRLMDISTMEESTLDVSFDYSMPNVEQAFANNGLSAITGTSLTGFESLQGFDSGIRIYPNPSTGMVYIDGLGENSTIKIFSAFGEEVKQLEKLPSNSFNLGKQPKGVYFIRIETDTGSHFEKLILN